MKPRIGHDLCVEGAARLRDSILMMREDEVDATADDVEGLPKMRRLLIAEHSICEPGAPGALDAGRVRPKMLAWASMASTARNPSDRDKARLQPSRPRSSRRANGPPACHNPASTARSKSTVVLGDIGMARGNEPLHQLPHLADMPGRPRLDGRQEPKRGTSSVKLLSGSGSNDANGVVQGASAFSAERASILSSTSVILWYIGDVLGPVEVPQQREQHVEDDDGPAHCRYGASP